MCSAECAIRLYVLLAMLLLAGICNSALKNLLSQPFTIHLRQIVKG